MSALALLERWRRLGRGRKWPVVGADGLRAKVERAERAAKISDAAIRRMMAGKARGRG